jgi:outer membrane lipoprotein carrier protein
MITTFLLSLALAAEPTVAQKPPPPAKAAAKDAGKSAAPKTTDKPAAKPEAAAPASPPAENKPAPQAAPEAPSAPMSPEVKTAVDRMQKFYEETRDFKAQFTQTYTYKSFGRSTKATGVVRFLKIGASMRWDYQKPNEKVFVVAGNKVYAYDKDAKQLTVSGINADQLSASITFLWGQGKLEREFNIKKADRKDLTDGIALELTPKRPDPRFQEIFFLVDPKTYAVKRTIVVDPDGSENNMAFADVKTNTGFGPEAFHIEPPPDTQILRMDK